MTIPINRKRQRHSKTKSGCRTCKERRVKCDEDRPSCQRCIKSGRECAGYDVPPARSSCPSLRPKSELAVAATSRSPNGGLSQFPCSVAAVDIQSFDYFRSIAIGNLAGADWRLAWKRLILPLCQTEPMVMRAAIALGSMHRAVASPSNELAGIPNASQWALAEAQYCDTISSMRRHIEAALGHVSSTSAEALLVVSLILFNFDMLADQSHRASLHLRHGKRILYDQMRNPTQDPGAGKRVVIYRVDPRTRLDLLTHTFVRLEADLSFLNNEDIFLSPVCDQPLPASFLSVEQAQVHLDVLENELFNLWVDLYDVAECDLETNRPDFRCLDEDMQDILVAATIRTTSLDAAPELAQRLIDMRQSLVQWTNALSFVPSPTPDDPFRMHVEIHFWYLWLTLSVMRDADELPTDNFEDQFKHFIGIIERFFNHQSRTTISFSRKQPNWPKGARSRPGLTVGTCFGLTTCLIIELCRTSWIRKRGIALIRAMDMRGVYDSEFLASYYEAIVDFEENAARMLSGNSDQVEFEAHEIPGEARILECDISNVFAARTDYFHADTGRMLFVKHGSNGQLDVFDRTFYVKRTTPITPADTIMGG